MIAPTLGNLRDIHLPPEPGLWPLAPGWWTVAAALALVAALLARRYLRRRMLRVALREADHLVAIWQSDADPVELARRLSQLLRRYALWRFPQERVGGLAGRAWLAFLDERGGNGEFADGVGALLGTLPYRPQARQSSDLASDARISRADGEALCALVRRWLKANAP